MSFSRYLTVVCIARKFLRSGEINKKVILQQSAEASKCLVCTHQRSYESDISNEKIYDSSAVSPTDVNDITEKPTIFPNNPSPVESNSVSYAPKLLDSGAIIKATSINEIDSECNELYSPVKLPKPLDTCTEDVSDVTPYFPPTFNFAAYANKSVTIQELIKLGVDLYKWERKPGILNFTLRLDFETHIKPYLTFLHDCGVPVDSLGAFITKNPLIFKEDMDDLHTRIRYLRAHAFDIKMISRIVSENPYWLLFNTKRIDSRIAFFQAEFALDGKRTRELVTKQPNLITYNFAHIRENTFAVREEMGFGKAETRSLLLKKPGLWMRSRVAIVERFDYAHNVMKLSHDIISKQPEVLQCRKSRLHARHKFLDMLNRAQYDPLKPLYISPKALVTGTDLEFCETVAKTPVATFNLFLKTL